MTDHLSDEYLQAAYYISDVMVLSSFVEGFGLVVIESWLYKKPVIVSSNAGVAELINGRNGFLFNPLNIEDLSNKMELILKNEKLASEMGLNGYETAKLCSLEEGYKKELEVLKTVLGEL